MTATIDPDIYLFNAFRRAFKSARSIKVKRESVWSSSQAGTHALPVEVWITRADGSVLIERGSRDEDLLAIAARAEAP